MIREAAQAVGDLNAIAQTGVRAVRTRLELLAIELQEEKAWAIRFVIVAVAAFFLFTFGLLLDIAALVLFASEDNRPAILAISAGVFLAAGIAGAAWIWLEARKRHPILEGILAVLKDDEQGLRTVFRGGND